MLDLQHTQAVSLKELPFLPGNGHTVKNPIGSMHGLFTCIWLKFMANLGNHLIKYFSSPKRANRDLLTLFCKTNASVPWNSITPCLFSDCIVVGSLRSVEAKSTWALTKLVISDFAFRHLRPLCFEPGGFDEIRLGGQRCSRSRVLHLPVLKICNFWM